MPATSKPVWSWISRKQVGLVTLTSVSQSPITSSPTSSRPRCREPGPSASAISRSRCRQRLRHAARRRRRGCRAIRPASGMRARQYGTELAVDQQHALVAVADLGDEALRHDAARAAVPTSSRRSRCGSGRRARTRKIRRRPCRRAASARRRRCSSMNACSVFGIARHQRGRGELRELRDRELLVVVADRAAAR